MPAKKKEEEKPKAVFGRVRNNLKMGIVGLPNVGKSSLFNLLTEQAVAAENYPFCTIEPTEARVPFPDARYDHLCGMWQPASRYPAYLMVTDIAGLVKGASQGEGLGRRVRECVFHGSSDPAKAHPSAAHASAPHTARPSPYPARPR